MVAFDNRQDRQITMELKVSVNGLKGPGDRGFAALLSKTGKDGGRSVADEIDVVVHKIEHEIHVRLSVGGTHAVDTLSDRFAHCSARAHAIIDWAVPDRPRHRAAK